MHAILIANDDLCNLFNFDENKSSFLTSENLAVQFLRLVPLQSECYHSGCLTLEGLTTGEVFCQSEARSLEMLVQTLAKQTAALTSTGEIHWDPVTRRREEREGHVPSPFHLTCYQEAPPTLGVRLPTSVKAVEIVLQLRLFTQVFLI